MNEIERFRVIMITKKHDNYSNRRISQTSGQCIDIYIGLSVVMMMMIWQNMETGERYDRPGCG